VCLHVANLGDYAVIRCLERCVLVCDPMPSKNRLVTAYSNFDAGELIRNEFDSYRAHAKNMLRGIFRKCRDSPSRGVTPRFLDCGCGGRHFVAAASALGYASIGIEIDAVSVRTGIHRGLDILQALLESSDALASDESFDVILMFHVLEHMVTPRKTLDSLVKHLRLGGTIVIGVPDQDSFPSMVKQHLRRFGLKRMTYGFVQPPIHVIGFNERSLRCLAKELEFSHMEIEKNDAIDPDSFPVGRKYWAHLPIQRLVYSIGAILGSGGHLLALFQDLHSSKQQAAMP